VGPVRRFTAARSLGMGQRDSGVKAAATSSIRVTCGIVSATSTLILFGVHLFDHPRLRQAGRSGGFQGQVASAQPAINQIRRWQQTPLPRPFVSRTIGIVRGLA